MSGVRRFIRLGTPGLPKQIRSGEAISFYYCSETIHH